MDYRKNAQGGTPNYNQLNCGKMLFLNAGVDSTSIQHVLCASIESQLSISLVRFLVTLQPTAVIFAGKGGSCPDRT